VELLPVSLCSSHFRCQHANHTHNTERDRETEIQRDTDTQTHAIPALAMKGKEKRSKKGKRCSREAYAMWANTPITLTKTDRATDRHRLRDRETRYLRWQ
jgi:hypothetical protein